MPEFSSITDPTTSLTTSSRIISVSPKRSETGSCTSINSARLDVSSISGLFSGVSIYWFLSSRAYVAQYDKRLVWRIRSRLRIQLVLFCDFHDHRRIVPLIQYQGVSHLKRHQRFHRERAVGRADRHTDR